jgi:transaldolase
MQGLLDMKQSVWLDDLSREMTRSGELRALIDSGIRGLTSNPTIFEQAIGGSTAYDDDLNKWSMSPETDHDVYERLAIQDVREAADLFRPVYDATGGRDGFVSLEVSPAVARDTEGSVKEARHLWRAVDRPNAMIKIPGTREGWPAIERCLAEGININITLLFSVQHYRAVADAWLHALEARVESGKSIENLASVASFFVSRVDSGRRLAAISSARTTCASATSVRRRTTCRTRARSSRRCANSTARSTNARCAITWRCSCSAATTSRNRWRNCPAARSSGCRWRA